MIKKITTIFIFLLLTNCGFSPIYKSESDLKFNLIIDKTVGEKEINRFIVNHLQKYTDTEVDKKINLEIVTTYSKINVSKDNQGSSTSYKLIATTTFNINYENDEKEVSFSENLPLSKFEDIFEEKRYETQIKNNIAQLIVEKLIRNLSAIR